MEGNRPGLSIRDIAALNVYNNYMGTYMCCSLPLCGEVLPPAPVYFLIAICTVSLHVVCVCVLFTAMTLCVVCCHPLLCDKYKVCVNNGCVTLTVLHPATMYTVFCPAIILFVSLDVCTILVLYNLFHKPCILIFLLHSMWIADRP